MSPRINRKPALAQRLTSKQHVSSTSRTLEPAKRSRDTAQQIPCFDRCQSHDHNIKEVHGKPRLHIMKEVKKPRMLRGTCLQ